MESLKLQENEIELNKADIDINMSMNISLLSMMQNRPLELELSKKLLTAHLSILIIYIILPSFVYSNQVNRPFLDSLCSSFALISTIHFPIEQQTKTLSVASVSESVLLKADDWMILFKCLYLIAGLNLIVSIFHLLAIIHCTWRAQHSCLARGDRLIVGGENGHKPSCNGTASSLVGTLAHHNPIGTMNLAIPPTTSLRTSPFTVTSFEPEALEVIPSPMSPIGINLNDDSSNMHNTSFDVNQTNQTTTTISSSSNASNRQQHSQQQQQQKGSSQRGYDLTELFVVSQQPTQGLHHNHLHHYHRHHAQLTSHHHHHDSHCQSSSIESTTNDNGSPNIIKKDSNDNICPNEEQLNYILTATTSTHSSQPSEQTLTGSSTDQSICLANSGRDNSSIKIYQHPMMLKTSNLSSINNNQVDGGEINIRSIKNSDTFMANHNHNHNHQCDAAYVPGSSLADGGDFRSNHMRTSGSTYSIGHGAPSQGQKRSVELYGHQVATLGRSRVDECKNKKQGTRGSLSNGLDSFAAINSNFRG